MKASYLYVAACMTSTADARYPENLFKQSEIWFAAETKPWVHCAGAAGWRLVESCVIELPASVVLGKTLETLITSLSACIAGIASETSGRTEVLRG